jgi:outer membrane protein TolC
VREAEHALAADARALEAQRNAAAFEREDAAAKVAAARSAFAILDASVLPDARRNFESTRAAYEAGQGTALGMIDALRSYWNVQLQRGRALARLQISLADYDRVAP